MENHQLQEYVNHSEKIYAVFYEAFLPFIFKHIIICIILAAALIFSLNYDVMYLSIALGVLWILYFTISLLIYYSTFYIITDHSIYKKTGILARNVRSASEDQVTHITVIQGIVNRFVWNTGHIHVNTEGSEGNEIELYNVSDPFQKVKFMKKIWNMDTST